MKIRNYAKSLISACVIIFALGCEKDNTLPVVPAKDKGNFYARIQNRDWSATNYYAEIKSGVLTIGGASSDGRVFSISTTAIDTGTFEVYTGTETTASFRNSDGSEIYTSDVDKKYKGSLRITQLSVLEGKISAQFNITLRNEFGSGLIAAEDGFIKDLSIGPLPKSLYKVIGLSREDVTNPGQVMLLSMGYTGFDRLNIDTLGAAVPYVYLAQNSLYQSAYFNAGPMYVHASGSGQNYVYDKGNATALSRNHNPALIQALGDKLYAVSQSPTDTMFYVQNLNPLNFNVIDTLTSLPIALAGVGASWKYASRLDDQLWVMSSSNNWFRYDRTSGQLNTGSLSLERPIIDAQIETANTFLLLQENSAQKIDLVRYIQSGSASTKNVLHNLTFGKTDYLGMAYSKSLKVLAVSFKNGVNTKIYFINLANGGIMVNTIFDRYISDIHFEE